MMFVPHVALLIALLAAGDQTPASSSDLSRLETLGQDLFVRDRAAALATDRVLESSSMPEHIRGWVTIPSGADWRVIFVEQQGDVYCSKLQVLVNKGGAGPPQRSDTCQALPAVQRKMFLARETAISALRDPCTRAYNTIVLPNEGPQAGWTVYLIAATDEAGRVVVGGHVRVLVRDEGLDIVDYHELSKTCLMLDSPPAAEKPVALVVSHVLDDHPTEMHVFLGLLHQLKLYVLTESAMWSVDHGKITLLMDGDDYKAYMERAKKAGAAKPSGSEH